MIRKILVAASMTALISACTSAPAIQTGDDAEVIGDNLHRVDNSRAKVAYVDPDADFTRYRRVLVLSLGVDKIEIVQPDKSGSAVNRRDWELTEADKLALQEMFQSAMEKQLQERGQFPLASEPGDDVLEIEAMITGIAPAAAKDDNMSRTAGRSYVITEGAGTIAVAVAFGDSETGEVLALFKDARSSSSHWGMNNSVTNRADVQRVFNSWAKQVNSSLVKVTGKGE